MMTPDILIAEGRRLARRTVFLRPSGSGPVAAIWHDCNEDEIDATGFRSWITVDASFIPGLPNGSTGYVSVFTNERKCVGGRIEIQSAPPTRPGLALYASEEQVIPPIEVVFAHGSAEVGQWLADNDWPRDERYNDNFRDSAIVDIYQRQWFDEYPVYRKDGTYAVLGGWHWPGADDDWHELIDEQLLIFTIHDSEPWVEAWRLRSGEFKVIQRGS